MGKRILVIDDELDIRDVVCLCLEEFGHWETGSAGSGREGLAMARQDMWDANFAGCIHARHGWVPRYLENLQASTMTQPVPVILLTAKVFDSELKPFEARGIAGVIP